MRSLGRSRCVVLGAGGFIGTNLCIELARQVGELRAFGRRQAFPHVFKGLEWHSGDFNDPTQVALAIEGCETVFHLVNASTPHSANADIAADATSSIIATIRFLDLCRVQGVRRVVFISSGGTVYGPQSVLPILETQELWPITAYGVAKVAIEKYFRLFEHLHGLEFRVLRVSNPYGPYQLGLKNQGAIAVFMRRALEKKRIEVWGDGMQSRDYVHVSDVVDALKKAATHEGSARIFNIGSGVPHTLRDVIAVIENVLQTKLEIAYLPARSVDVPSNYLDISLAQIELGWQPTIGLEEGLVTTANWLRALAYQTLRGG